MAFRGYCGVHFRKLKTAAHIKKACSHDRRGHTPQNVNPDRMSRNIALLDHGRDRWDVINEQISKRVKRKVRDNAVRMVEAFVYSSPEYFRPQDPENRGTWDEKRLQPWVKKVHDWLLKEYGEDNVLEIHLHLDEATPHIHAVLVPITKDGRLTAKEWLMNRGKLRNAQSSLAKALQPLGLIRGLKGSGAKHIPADKWAAEIQKCLNTLANIPKPEPAGKLSLVVSKDKYQKLEDDYLSVVAALRKAEKRAAHIQTVEAENSQLKKVNSAYALELKALRPLATKVRGIGLDLVVADHPKGYTVSVKDREAYVGDKRVARNAIDLIKYLDGCDYRQAVLTLALNYSPTQAAATEISSLVEERLEKFDFRVLQFKQNASEGKKFDSGWKSRSTVQRQYYVLYRYNIDKELIANHQIWENKNGRFLRNTEKDYHIWDKGDRLILRKAESTDLRRAVALMLEVAVDKGWDLEQRADLATGSDEFLSEVRRQVEERISAKEEVYVHWDDIHQFDDLLEDEGIEKPFSP